MKKTNAFFTCLILLAFACSSPKKESESQLTNSNEWELQIVDSIQVDYLGRINGGEFKNGRGVISNFNTNTIIEFDETGAILSEHTFPTEGPGKVYYPSQLRFGNNNNLYVASFVGWLYELNDDLSFKREIKLPFPSEAKDGGGLLRNLSQWDKYLITYYPGRDGADPYAPHFFKDHYLLEKINPETGDSQPIIETPPASRYSTDKYFERPWVQFGISENSLVLTLSNEPLVHFYDLSEGGKLINTIDFKPSKFLDNGEHSDKYQYISRYKMLDGGIKQLFPTTEGVVILFTEGINEDLFAQNNLKDPKNFEKYPDFQKQLIKIILPDSTLTNEIDVSYKIGRILNIESLDKPFYALRNDEYIGEEQDYLTFYKLQLIQK